MSKKTLIVVAAILLLLAGGAAYFAGGSGTRGTGTANLPPDKITAEDMTMGIADAPVTMIEYYAQACSICARFSQDVFPLIKAKYIDTGKVRYVMRLYPLFPVDGPSYKLSRCVPRESYFQAVDLLFRSQPHWDTAEFPGADADAGLIQVARIMGMREEQARACMKSTEHDDAINRIAQEATERYNPSGTPTFAIDFKKVELPQKSWVEAEAAIDAALAVKGVN